jgi:hypothetical protein
MQSELFPIVPDCSGNTSCSTCSRVPAPIGAEQGTGTLWGTAARPAAEETSGTLFRLFGSRKPSERLAVPWTWPRASAPVRGSRWPHGAPRLRAVTGDRW